HFGDGSGAGADFEHREIGREVPGFGQLFDHGAPEERAAGREGAGGSEGFQRLFEKGDRLMHDHAAAGASWCSRVSLVATTNLIGDWNFAKSIRGPHSIPRGDESLSEEVAGIRFLG
ncbi:MAG: hypothetical protein KIS92_22805, partial [Planctomycetota bacterium]|nr:hypothetical protein [Planctomycetota bacterium]